jgi:hypothetical protein
MQLHITNGMLDSRILYKYTKRISEVGVFGKTICVALLQLAMPDHDFSILGDRAPNPTAALDSAQKTVQGAHALISNA